MSSKDNSESRMDFERENGECKETETRIAEDSVKVDISDGVNKSKTNLPIDRGWAWVVLIACSIEMFIAVGFFKCFGIFFVELQRRFKSSSSATSALSSIQNAFYSITALCVMTMGQSMSSRVSVVIGASFVSLSFLLTAFMPNLGIVYLTGGVLTGGSFAFIQPQIMTMLSTYFDKYRGFANNFASAFVSVGALAMAPVYTKLFEYYGFTGTYMLLAALMFNIVAVGMLLRPMEFYKNRKQTEELTTEESDRKILLEDGLANGLTKHSPQDKCGSEISLKSLGLQQVGFVHNSITDLRPSNSLVAGKSPNNTDTVRERSILYSIKQVPVRLFSNSLLKKRVFLYYLMCNAFMCSGCIIVESYIAPHAVDKGIDDDRVALLISSIAISDLCAKFFIGYLSDRKWIKRSTIMATAAVLLGIFCFFVPFYNSFWTIFIYAVFIGILQPVYFSLYAVVAVDVLSLGELKNALGYLALTQGAAGSSSYPIAGYLRDYTGNYHATIWFGGSLLTVGGILCFYLPAFKARTESMAEHRSQVLEEEKANLQTNENENS